MNYCICVKIAILVMCRILDIIWYSYLWLLVAGGRYCLGRWLNSNYILTWSWRRVSQSGSVGRVEAVVQCQFWPLYSNLIQLLVISSLSFEFNRNYGAVFVYICNPFFAQINYSKFRKVLEWVLKPTTGSNFYLFKASLPSDAVTMSITKYKK